MKRRIAGSEVGLKDIAVIIPVGPGETAWKDLLGDLSRLPKASEIILVATSDAPENWPTFERLHPGVSWISSAPGRAIQMNRGVGLTNKKYLWFVHADSRVSSENLSALKKVLLRGGNALYFFDLKFLNDGSRLVWFNERGAWIRSRLLGIPFGDQGFFFSRKTFDRLGGFDEKVPCGEDHLFVWKAKTQRVQVVCLDSPLKTSARKYKGRLWLSTTLRHMYLTFRQTVSQFRNYQEGRKPV